MTTPTSDPTKSTNTPPLLTPQDSSQSTQADRTPVPPASPHSGSLSHRSSFADGMRPHPPSPRNQRHPSLSQAAVQELLNNPTPLNKPDSRFTGRDWRSIEIGELVTAEDVRFVETNTSVEEATNILITSGSPRVVLIREDAESSTACGTFDYGDLNAYLLVVLGLGSPDPEMIETYTEIARKGREGVEIPLGDVVSLAKKAPLVTLEESESLSAALEFFAGGVHRIIVVKDGTQDVVGVLSQFKLLNFLGDKPLTEALLLMSTEGLSSLAVVDNGLNVIGNISTTDVKHLTKTSSLPLLKSSCTHFISVILMERGTDNGKDSVPVFHVHPSSTLAHTVAKLVATTSQRMWVTESPSPAPTPTPQAVPSVLAAAQPHGTNPSASPPLSPAYPSISAASYPGVRSGRLTGVISLTDVLNLFARQSGLQTQDPNEERQHRRRSSSISSMPRPNLPKLYLYLYLPTYPRTSPHTPNPNKMPDSEPRSESKRERRRSPTSDSEDERRRRHRRREREGRDGEARDATDSTRKRHHHRDEDKTRSSHRSDEEGASESATKRRRSRSPRDGESSRRHRHGRDRGREHRHRDRSRDKDSKPRSPRRDRDRDSKHRSPRPRSRDRNFDADRDTRPLSNAPPSPMRKSNAPLPSQQDSFSMIRGGGHGGGGRGGFGGGRGGHGGGHGGGGAGDDTTMIPHDGAPPPEKKQPNFAPTGLLAAETKTVTTSTGAAIVLKYHEPPEARKPPPRDAWKLFVFKNGSIVDTIDLGSRSCWLIGRDAAIADLPAEHPSISKQHAVIQFRFVEKVDEYGERKGGVKPYLLDLESANGTKLNGGKVEGARFVEVRGGDLLAFGESTREYVVMLPKD
ncbi:hypothetical protein V501_03759 [Pseudogymnoascus sp. VKM F-4519 (FW-2642)]|nr:hypothetical protein V501_03759 [Pseudogymnoascus sp. VKM F-4519 (FW-2642)]